MNSISFFSWLRNYFYQTDFYSLWFGPPCTDRANTTTTTTRTVVTRLNFLSVRTYVFSCCCGCCCYCYIVVGRPACLLQCFLFYSTRAHIYVHTYVRTLLAAGGPPCEDDTAGSTSEKKKKKKKKKKMMKMKRAFKLMLRISKVRWRNRSRQSEMETEFLSGSVTHFYNFHLHKKKME